MHYKGWDETATKNKTKRFLKSYYSMRLERAHLRLKDQLNTNLQAVQYDGMPKSETNRNTTEEGIIKQFEKADRRREELSISIANIHATLEVMRSEDDCDRAFAKLLDCRYIQRMSITKCCFELADEFNQPGVNGPVPEQTMYKKQDQALLTFAEIYPRRSDVVVEKKKDDEKIDSK